MTTVRRWAYALFGTPGTAILSIVMLGLFAFVGPVLVRWALVLATWTGESRDACRPDGACWAFIAARHGRFLYGNYPVDQLWRVGLSLLLLCTVLPVVLFARRGVARRLLLLAAGFSAAAILLRGGVVGLGPVPTADWGGLLLNGVVALVAITLSVPLGILLALGRQSRWPVAALLSTAYVEFWRGVPLLAVLFAGVIMLPLFLPSGVTVENLVRAILVLTCFAAAYMAEVVRGALLSVPRGQDEAAAALGLDDVRIKLLVVLPQAMRLAVPGIANIAIDLFKDTALISVVGFLDLSGITSQSTREPAWLGLSIEAYAFSALLFAAGCLLMSQSSQVLERRLARPYARMADQSRSATSGPIRPRASSTG